jgi:hypothetical protein
MTVGSQFTSGASTVFFHQHHLLDVATGLRLAAAVRRVLPLDEVRDEMWNLTTDTGRT